MKSIHKIIIALKGRNRYKMSQSLSKLYIHIIFRTKKGEFKLTRTVQEELYAYIDTILKAKESTAIIINGSDDHIHILCILSKNIALSKLIEEIKKNSSKWLKTKGSTLGNFKWQNGYGAFSVSQSQVENVKKYINNQEKHHKKRSFQD